jgi:hypothetical protein
MNLRYDIIGFVLHADCIFFVKELIIDYVRETHQTQLNRVKSRTNHCILTSLCKVWHVFYLSPMYTSWPAVWHYRPFDQCWSRSVRANWRGLYGITDSSISVDRGLYGPISILEEHLRFLKNRTSWTRHLKFLTVCMISLCICQPRVLKRRSGLLDHPTFPFLVCPFLQSVACF